MKSPRFRPLLIAFLLGFAMFLVSILAAELALFQIIRDYVSYSPFGYDPFWPAILWIASSVGLVAAGLTLLVSIVSWTPDLRVVARIMANLAVDGPTKRTNLSSRSGLNYRSFKKYLKWMIDHELVNLGKDNEGLEVFLTPAGQASNSFFVSLLQAPKGVTAKAAEEVTGKV